jgi:hypothetical protein
MLSRAIGGWVNAIEGDRRMGECYPKGGREGEIDNNEREREGERGSKIQMRTI